VTNKKYKKSYHRINKAKINKNKSKNKFLKNLKLSIVLKINQEKYNLLKTNPKFSLLKLFQVKNNFHNRRT